MSAEIRCELLAIDLDGTLLDADHRVPQRNREALHRAHAAGIRVVLCTGRSFVETLPVLDEIGLDLDAAVTASGAIVIDVASSRTIQRASIARDTSLELTAWFARRGYPVLWLLDREQAGFDGYEFDGPRRCAGYDRWLERTPCDVKRLTGVPDEFSEPVRISVIDQRHVLSGISQELRREFNGRLTHNHLRAPTYDVSVIEAFAPQVNKWYGIQALCRRWNIDPRRTVAIGDDVNDIDMLQSAGLGAVVANAMPEARQAADREIAANNACGVADLVDEILRTGCHQSEPRP